MSLNFVNGERYSMWSLSVTSRWFSLGNPVSCTKTSDRHDIIEILLKVALCTISQSKVSVVHTVALGVTTGFWWGPCCVPNIASVSVLSILHCLFGFLYRLYVVCFSDLEICYLTVIRKCRRQDFISTI